MLRRLLKHRDLDLKATDLLDLTPSDWMVFAKWPRRHLAPHVANLSSAVSLSPLHLAVAEENLDRVRSLLRANGTDVNARMPGKIGLTPVMVAILFNEGNCTLISTHVKLE